MAAAGLEAGGAGGRAGAGAGGVGGGGKGKVGTEKELVCRCCERRASGCATPWTAAAVRLACLRACHGRTGASSSVARTGGGKRGPSRSHPVNPRPPKRAVRLLEWQCGVAMAAANEAEWASWRARIHQAQVLERFYALSQDRPLVPVRAPAETVFDLSSATTNPSTCTCCRTLTSMRQGASQLNAAVLCRVCGTAYYSGVTTLYHDMDTRKQVRMLNAEFLVQHDRRTSAEMAEIAARQNTEATERHIEQVLLPRRVAERANNKQLFEQMSARQAFVKKFRFKTCLREKVLVSIKTVTMRPQDMSLQPGHWVLVLKNDDEGVGLWEDYLDVVEIQRVSWRHLYDNPALRDRVIRDEDLDWAKRQLGWRGAMDKLEKRLRGCYPPGGKGSNLFARDSHVNDKGGLEVVYRIKPDVVWDLIWFRHRRVHY